MLEIRDTPSGATLIVRVQPRARKNAITGEIEGALKLALTAPPVEGKANEACVKFLANFLQVPRTYISIVSGETGRRKVIRVAGWPAKQLRQRLSASVEAKH